MPNVSGSGERTRIQLCGRLSVELDGVELAAQLRGRQVPLLLAYLVLSRSRTVGREELIGALWPDNAPRSQDGALRTLLSRLRSALGSEVLVGRDELVLELPEPAWVDFEAAAEHINLAQEALEAGDVRRAWARAQVPINIASRGLLPGAQASWLDARRRDLEDIHLQALEVIGRAGLVLGGTQVSSVERAARSLIGAEPYRETGYVLLMQALQAQGNVAAGMRVFEQLRTLLREELGTAPSPEAIAVHEQLLNPGGRAPAPAAPLPPRPPAALEFELPAELRVRAGPEMIGRVQELSTIERWLTQSRDQEPQRVLLLGGDPGIGKTRLLAETAARAHGSGTLVLAGRSPEETLVPFQPFLEALGHYVQSAPTDELRSTARAHGAELVRLVPELGRRIPELAASTDGDRDTERYRLFEAAAGLLGEVAARRPVLIVLDDLQWADRPTLLLLRHLARAPQAAGLSILAAYRTTEQGNDGFNAALTTLRHERMLKQIEVRGLPERDAARLVGLRAGHSPDGEFLHALYTETDGNPFFLEEIIRHLQDSGVAIQEANTADLQRVGLPEDVREVILRRLERLSPDGLEVLRTASVAGRDFDARPLEGVLGLDEDSFLAALEEALGARLVEQSPSRPESYTFSHALIRETLYETMSPTRRARIHRRIGLALERDGEQSHALALHFARAAAPEDAERAIRYALQAGAEATRMLAHEQAVEHYSGALEVLQQFEPENRELRCEVLLEVGEARVRAGERPKAWPVFREAAALAAELNDGERLARAAVGASRRYVQPPGIIDEELIALLERALEITDRAPSVTRVLLLCRLCGALYYAPRSEEMRRLSAEATVLAGQLSDPRAAALAAAARRRAYWAPGHLERRLADSTQLLRAAREAEDLDLTLQGHAWLVVDLMEAGDRAAVEAQIEAFTTIAEELRQPLFLWQAAVWRPMKAILAGHLRTAERLAEEAMSAGIRPEQITAPQYQAIQLLAIRREQARFTELEAPLRALMAEHPHRPAWRAALAALLADTGRSEEAREHLHHLHQSEFEDIPKDGDWMTAMTLLAEAAASVGDAAVARTLYGLMLPYRNTNVVVGIGALCLGSVSRYLGRLALSLGDEQRALAHLEFALRANQSLGALVQAAHTQLDWALALGSGQRSAELFLAASRAAEELDLGLLRQRLEARAI